jgi:hypothetical protein
MARGIQVFAHVPKASSAQEQQLTDPIPASKRPGYLAAYPEAYQQQQQHQCPTGV